jgi:hypothetical protein
MGIFDKLFGNKKDNAISEPAKNISFTSSEELIDEDRFWEIIMRSKALSGDNYEKQQEHLDAELRKLSADELILFGNRFSYFRGEANTWEMWGAVYIIHGGCSDDSFNDFREWVIGQGKDFYYKTIKDPESLVEVETSKIDIDWEGLGYVPSTVFEEITGKEMPYPFQEKLETTGRDWEEDGDDLKNMFPKLYAKYEHNF